MENVEKVKDEKEKPVETVMAINVGAVDISGNKVTHVLVKHNEFAIYEIDTPDINNKIRTLIDGKTNEREKNIQKRFNKVKQKYIQAIGMLPNSPNIEMLKRRIAHTLSSCLSGEDIDGVVEFDNLISTIQIEHQKLVTNRILYLSPMFFTTLIFLVLCLYFLDLDYLTRNIIDNKIYFCSLFLSVLVGGSVSILVNATKLNFEEYLASKYYFLLGVERLFLAIFAGCVAFISIKAGLLFPDFTKNSLWAMMVALIVVGFSESLIPSFLTKINHEK